MKSYPSSLIVVCLSLFLLWGGAESAQAKRGFKLFTIGDTIEEIGVPKDQGKSANEAAAAGEKTLSDGQVKVGFFYKYAGLFWLDFWNWSGEYCMYQGNSFKPITKEEAEQILGKSVSSPLNYKLPYGLTLLLGFLALKFGWRYWATKRAAAAAAAEGVGSVGDYEQRVDRAPAPDLTEWAPTPAPPLPTSAAAPPPMPPPLPPQ